MTEARKAKRGPAVVGRLAVTALAIAIPVLAIVFAALALSAVASPGSARAATNPAALDPVPLRQLDSAPNGRYFYTTDLAEAEAAPKFGLTMTSPRPLAYVFKTPAPDTVPLYRLKQKATGNWLESSSPSEIHELVEVDGTFEVEGVSGYLYAEPEFGAEPLQRFSNANGWRLAFATEAAALEAAGYRFDGTAGYALRRYFKVGAYYFGAYDQDTNPRLLEASERLFGRRDPWVGVRDFSGDDPSVPQDTQGWGGDWSDLEPEIGFYDDSKPEVLKQQIQQAASHGLSYFAFYEYWNDQTGAPQYDDALKAFLQARNRESMKFMITPCITPNEGDTEHLDLPESQFAAAAADFAALTEAPNYLTTDDGRPMIFMCDARGIGSTTGAFGSVAQQNRFLGMLRAAVEADTGKNPYVLIDSDFSGPEETRQLAGDAYSCINIGRYVLSGSYREYVEKQAEYFSAFDAIRPTMRCAMSGFDERPRTGIYFPAGQPSQARYFKDDTKVEFPEAMESTRRDMEGEPATVVDNYLSVYAWNEWAEGGHIEPNVRDHAYYLEALQRIFGLIPRDASIPAPAPPSPAPPAPQASGGGAPGRSKSAPKPPRLSKLKLKPRRFKVGKGTIVSWHDSAAANTRLVVLAKKKRHGKARWVSRGFFSHKDDRGANAVRFSGRLKGKALRPGRYRLRLVAGLAGTHSAAVAKAFAVARPRR